MTDLEQTLREAGTDARLAAESAIDVDVDLAVTLQRATQPDSAEESAHSTRRTYLFGAAATLVSVLIGGLLWIGDGDADIDPVSPVSSHRTTTQPSSTVDASSEGEAVLLRIGDALKGTAADRDALDRLRHAEFQGSIQACMEQAGFSYTPPPLLPSGRSETDRHLPGLSDVLIEISDGDNWPADFGIGATAGRSLRMLDQLGLEPGQLAPNPGHDVAVSQADYDRHVNQCVPDTTERSLPHTETLFADLADLVHTEIRRDPLLVEAMEAYSDCMSSFGFEGIHSRVELGEALANNYSRIAVSDGVDSAEWAAAYKRETLAAEADTTCRAEAHDRAVKLVTPLVLEWESNHTAQLAANRLAWQRVRDDSSITWTRFLENHPSRDLAGGGHVTVTK